MNEQSSLRSRYVSICVLSLVNVVACSGSEPNPAGGSAGSGGSVSGQSGSGGVAGVSGGAAQPGALLQWEAQGFVAPDNNPFSIQGPFYSYSDCEPPSGLPCTMPDAALTGADAKPGWSVDAGRVCMKGTAVKVEGMMFAAQWGAGLALDLNSKGGEPGAPAAKGTFDLTQAKITGFSVDISGTAPARIRINLTMPGVADSNFVDAKLPGTTTFALGDAKQGSWVTSKTPLDPSKVEAIQFQVFTNATSATPYDFCIDAIRAITEAP
jgi:hypothetical protein